MTDPTPGTPRLDRLRRQSRWTKFDTIIAAALALGAALICLAAIVRRADINASATFLFSDAGANLLIAEKLSEGGRLYRDAASSYGPLAIYPYAWFSRLAGNTAQAFSAFLAMSSVVTVVLAYILLRRHVSRLSAVVVAVVGLYATLLLPGSLIFGVQGSGYVVLERVLLLGVIFSWTPPAERRPRHALALGVLLGVWQGVRFGTAFFVGGAVVLVDALAMYLVQARREEVMRWVRISLITLGCFVAIQAGWVLAAYATLPAADARDFLWPSYVLEGFEEWPEDRRWPRYEEIRLFVGQQLLPLGCAALGLVALFRIVRARRSAHVSATPNQWRITPGDLALLIPLAFYALGTAALFRSVYHFHQYAWTLPLVAALAVDRGTWRYAAAFLLVSGPALAIMLRANLITRPSADAVAVRPPAGGRLMLTPAEQERVEALREYATQPVRRSLIIMTVGAGFHVLYDTPARGRQMFYIVGFARGDDENTTLETLASGPSAIVLTDHPAGQVPGADPCKWYGWRHFSTDFCPRLAQRVDVARAIRVDETTWIIPAADGAGGSGESTGSDTSSLGSSARRE